MRVSPEVKALLPQITAFRDELHAHPEPSGAEYATQARIIEWLKPLRPDKIEICAETGLRAVFLGDAPAIAFRADMDALPVQEQSDHPSQNSGWMHACGHDGHMSMLLALALWIAQLREQGRRHPTVVLLFQPAEENEGGAERMIRQGALDNPHVEAVYGIHIMPHLPAGKIGLRSGALMAQNVEFDIEIEGRSAHGALPHQGVDALNAAMQLYAQLQTLLTRGLNPFQPVLLSIGRLTAGDARNVVPEYALLECMARSFSPEQVKIFLEKLQGLLRGLEQGHGVAVRYTERVSYPPVINDTALFERAKALSGAAFLEPEPVMAAEDFSFFQLSRPGLFAFLGTGDARFTAPLHSCRFDFEPATLLWGVEYYARIVQSYMASV